jgi:hypothetical protein
MSTRTLASVSYFNTLSCHNVLQLLITIANVFLNLSGVFYCGSPTLTKQLKELSKEFSQTTTTRFHFHKENF